MATIHEPVLLKEVVEYLALQPNYNIVDGTFGGGGHALAILEKIKPKGKLIGIDWDPAAVQTSSHENLLLINDNYSHLKKIVDNLRQTIGLGEINGILLDLGFSSDQVGAEDRGFSFESQAPLDLRYNKNATDLTGAEILKRYSEQKLFEIFKQYGEEPLARLVAKKISVDRREGKYIETAEMLVQLVSNIYRHRFKSFSRRNPATRVWQALRIEVNDEWGNIARVLPQALSLLTPGGRLAVISFHSGEDRLIKQFFKEAAKKESPKLKILTKKPLVASEAEQESNPRSRSAKLRVAEKL